MLCVAEKHSRRMHEKPVFVLSQKTHRRSVSFMPQSWNLCLLVVWQVELRSKFFTPKEFRNGRKLGVEILVEVEVVDVAPNPRM